MNRSIASGGVGGRVTAPTSKSYAQRAVAAALLAEGESVLTHMALCNDTRAALGVAACLGASVEADATTYRIRGGLNPRRNVLDIGESGLSARLFTPIAALCGEELTIGGSGSILKRPVGMMEAPLRALGADVSTRDGYLPIRVRGPVRGGEVRVDGSLSSQFITGLLMALPLAQNDTVLIVDDLKSRPYVEMTLGLVRAFGVDVRHEEYERFYIGGGQRYLPTVYNVEGDWSGASCLLVAGAACGEVTVENLDTASLQADAAIVDALAAAGAEIETVPGSVTVRRRRPLQAFEFDATHCPDLFPALAALASACRGTSVIRGTERLTHKESDRARTIAEVFGRMGIEVDVETENIMRVTGGRVHGARVSSHNDHRIAMAAAVTALRSDSEVTVLGAEAVDKSYPGFWDDLDSLRRPEVES